MARIRSEHRHTQPSSGEIWSPSPVQPLLSARRLRLEIDVTTWMLAAMWLFIAAVSALDVYMSIKYQYRLIDEEWNPLGRWLMAIDGGSVGLFLSCKFFGNVVTLAVLQALYFSYRTLCLIATSVLMVLQGFLAIILLV
ncbi:MAG TPA: hypothetical protein VFB96_20550 [Pirellulaceae bacterium]|nr:hypothetical protein [Pirellulaceae bacterium]